MFHLHLLISVFSRYIRKNVWTATSPLWRHNLLLRGKFWNPKYNNNWLWKHNLWKGHIWKSSKDTFLCVLWSNAVKYLRVYYLKRLQCCHWLYLISMLLQLIFFLNCSNKQQVLEPQQHHLVVLHRRALPSLVHSSSRQQAGCLDNSRHNSLLLVSVILVVGLVQLVVVDYLDSHSNQQAQVLHLYDFIHLMNGTEYYFYYILVSECCMCVSWFHTNELFLL